ncbi:MAG: response regulator transcription factor [Anaerolineaceae bacterium]|nr:response regulator transcription factor [Anaerolineaceae bacterium]
MAKPIRVMLVDDNLDFLRSAKKYLTLQPSLQIVGSASSGKEALKQIPTLRPDLVLMDWTMPEMSGLEATRQIKQHKKAPRIVILTLHIIPTYQNAAQAAGADGFISKSNWNEELIPLIQSLFE